MVKNSASNLLTSVDSLFTTQSERDEARRETVVMLSPSEISDFPNHPFKVRMDESMTEMVESVKQYGVLLPALVRPKPDGGYEMVSGHRRKRASEIAGCEIPCIVRELTDEEATIIMVDSNLQRETILPSEKAYAYKMKLDALKRQGERTDLTSRPLGEKSYSVDQLSSEMPDMTLKGSLSHTFSLGADVFGNITRMDNAIDGLPTRLEAVRDELENTKVQLERARTDMNEPFPKEAELAEKTARLKTLNILLNMDQKDKEILDDVPEGEVVEKEKVKPQAR